MPEGDSLTAPAPRRRRLPGCVIIALTLLGAAALSVIAAALAAWLVIARVSKEAREMATTLAYKVRQELGIEPEVRVDGVVVIQGVRPAMEVVTSSSEILARHRWSHRWLGSTKHLELEAVFVARFGFTPEKPLRLAIDGTTSTVAAEIPSPMLLSLEMGDPKILRDEDGLWNRLTAADREEAFRALREQARQKAESPSHVQQARAVLESRILAILHDRPTSSTPAGQTAPPAQ